MIPRISKSFGLSLIEVIVAICIFMLGAVAILNLFPWALRNAGKSQTITIATLLAQGKMEVLLAGKFSDPAPPDGAFPTHPGYSYHVEKTDYASQLKRVDVKVFHQENQTAVLAAELSTLQSSPFAVSFSGAFAFQSSTQVNPGTPLMTFYADPRNRKFYWKRMPGAVSEPWLGGNLATPFQPIKVGGGDLTLPEDGIPTNVSVSQATLVDIGQTHYYPVIMTVYDQKNKCFWGTQLTNQVGSGYSDTDLYATPGFSTVNSYPWTKLGDSTP